MNDNVSTAIYAIKSTNSNVLIQTNNSVRRFTTNNILDEFPNSSSSFIPIPDNYDIILVEKFTNLGFSTISGIKKASNTPSSSHLSSPNPISSNSHFSPSSQRILPQRINERIPRPKNKFILFSNDVRAKLQQEYPNEPNKLISKRIGKLWKSLDSGKQNEYANLAQLEANKHDEEHPNYKYKPKKRKRYQNI
jgi:hypothetical protein